MLRLILVKVYIVFHVLFTCVHTHEGTAGGSIVSSDSRSVVSIDGNDELLLEEEHIDLSVSDHVTRIIMCLITILCFACCLSMVKYKYCMLLVHGKIQKFVLYNYDKNFLM